MDSLESEPVIPNLDLPENIRNTHVKTRKPLFWKVVQEVVNEIFMEFHNPGCLPPVHLDFEDTSVSIPREQLCKNGYVDLKMSTGEVYRVFNIHMKPQMTCRTTPYNYLCGISIFVNFKMGYEKGTLSEPTLT